MSLRLPYLKDRAVARPDLIERLCRSGWIGQPFRGNRRIAIGVGVGFQSVRILTANGTDLTPRIPVSTRIAIETHLGTKDQRATSVYFAMTSANHDAALWILDCLKFQGRPLMGLSFEKRWDLVPRGFIDPRLKIALTMVSPSRLYDATDYGPVLMRCPTSWGWFPSSALLLDARPRNP